MRSEKRDVVVLDFKVAVFLLNSNALLRANITAVAIQSFQLQAISPLNLIPYLSQ